MNDKTEKPTIALLHAVQKMTKSTEVAKLLHICTKAVAAILGQHLY